MPDLGPYAIEVLSAYAVTIVPLWRDRDPVGLEGAAHADQTGGRGSPAAEKST